MSTFGRDLGLDHVSAFSVWSQATQGGMSPKAHEGTISSLPCDGNDHRNPASEGVYCADSMSAFGQKRTVT